MSHEVFERIRQTLAGVQAFSCEDAGAGTLKETASLIGALIVSKAMPPMIVFASLLSNLPSQICLITYTSTDTEQVVNYQVISSYIIYHISLLLKGLHLISSAALATLLLSSQDLI